MATIHVYVDPEKNQQSTERTVTYVVETSQEPTSNKRQSKVTNNLQDYILGTAWIIKSSDCVLYIKETMKLTPYWLIVATASILIVKVNSKGNTNSDGCSENDIRLEDNYSNNTNAPYGRVEVCLNGTWGTVCDDGWDSHDATTVCRQLGYNNTIANIGIPTRRAGIFGPGSGPIHLSRAQCRNDDTILTDCNIDKTGVNNCQHSEDAGVICMGPFNCTDGEVRLVGGENEREGHVEICYSGVWGTVCDDGWDEVDASVVCSQLGYGRQATHTTNLNETGKPVLLSHVTCNKSHSQLSQCVHPESIGLNNCDRSSLAGVICSGNGSNLSTINPALTYTSTVLTTNTESSTDLISTAPSNIQQSAILGAVGGALALVVIIAAVIVLVVLVVRTRQRQKYKDNLNFIGMKENEAYGTAQQSNAVLTEPNEAYGTAQQRNVVVTQPNEAYGTLEEDYVTVV